jgi:hypothetical protein
MTWTRWLLLPPLVLAACSGGDDDTTGVASLEDEVAATTATVDDGADDTDDVDDTDDSPTIENTEAQMLEFSSCMRDAGVDIGDPVVDADGNVTFGGFRPGAGGGADGEGRPDDVREAFDTCGEFLDGVQLGGPGGGADRTELQDTLLEFAQCMRDEGVDMDDPDFSSFGEPGQGDTPGPIGGLFSMLNSDDPDVQAATEICGDLLAGFGPGAGRPPFGGGDDG